MSQKLSTCFRTKWRCLSTELLTRVGKTWVFKKLPWGNWNPILWPFIKQTNEHIHNPQYPQTYYIARVWTNGSATSVISALGRLRQKDFSAFQASLTYKTNPSSSPKGEKNAFAWYCSWFLDHFSGLGKKITTSPVLGSSSKKLLSLIWKQLGGSSLQETKPNKKHRVY